MDGRYFQDQRYSFSPSNPYGLQPHPYFLRHTPPGQMGPSGPYAAIAPPLSVPGAATMHGYGDAPTPEQRDFINPFKKAGGVINWLLVGAAAFALWWLLKKK